VKFRLLGIQDLLLDDSNYWKEGTRRAQDGLLTPPQGKGIDWPIEDLKELAEYAEITADARSTGYTLEPSDRSEVRSLRSLARRLRKAIAKAEGGK
jgi:hypothetical protein